MLVEWAGLSRSANSNCDGQCGRIGRVRKYVVLRSRGHDDESSRKREMRWVSGRASRQWSHSCFRRGIYLSYRVCTMYYVCVHPSDRPNMHPSMPMYMVYPPMISKFITLRHVPGLCVMAARRHAQGVSQTMQAPNRLPARARDAPGQSMPEATPDRTLRPVCGDAHTSHGSA